MKTIFITGGIALLLCLASRAPAQSFQITNSFINAQGKFTVMFPSDPDSYFILMRNSSLHNITNAVAMTLGASGGGQLSDATAASGSAAFKVLRVPLSAPRSSAGDGIDDVYKLQHPNVFPDPLNPIYATLDFDGDGVSNLREYQRGTDPANPASVNINLFANAQTGSDANDGVAASPTPWAMGTHAPVQTIQAAISVSVSGDNVVIAAGTYHTTLLDPGNKTVTLSPQGSVVIQ